MKEKVTLVEVGARDGLQNEAGAEHLSAADKAHYIALIAQAGLRRIEAGSFVHPRAVPAMANSADVALALVNVAREYPDAVFSYLVPNLKGLERAREVKAKEIAIFLGLSESFSRANINQTVDESFENIAPVVQQALQHTMRVRGYLSNVFGYSDLEFSPEFVARKVQQLLQMGCFEISLGDTTALATPDMVSALIAALQKNAVPLQQIAMHCHDTSGRAIDNVSRSYDLGIRIFDASTGGLGGCPYANSPKGNVAMEAVVAWATQSGIATPVTHPEKLAEAARFMRRKLEVGLLGADAVTSTA